MIADPATTPETLQEALNRVHRSLPSAAYDAPAPRRWARTDAALEDLAKLFGLSGFERDLVALCAGHALEGRYWRWSPDQVAAATEAGEPGPGPSFGLALSSLDAPHWSAMTPAGPLRYWNLLEIGAGPLLDAPLSLDERILWFILGVPAFDAALQCLVSPIDPAPAPTTAATTPATTPTAAALAAAVRLWQRDPSEPILIIGHDQRSRRRAFAEICAAHGLTPYALPDAALSADPLDLDQLLRRWIREATLSGAALCLDIGDQPDIARARAWLELARTPTAVAMAPGGSGERLDGLRVEITGLTPHERAQLWASELGVTADKLTAGEIDRIAEYFDFDLAAIHATALQVGDALAADPKLDPAQTCWSACRARGRRGLEVLAERIEARAEWDDLVLAPRQRQILQQIPIHFRNRATVNELWGFAGKHGRGLGLTALFAGPSGTGKTMAAEVLAVELELDLFRIDLASVVSKYIGETERNLRAIFDGAQRSGAILLFDEADALFGKRSEVRDSHDRYANLEISYLLQQMETYRGVAILTTNMLHAIDQAFSRRLRFVLQFPFPDEPARAAIWRKVFPAATPLGELAFDRLAQLNVSGGVIRNIATHAAFAAAQDGGRVEHRHILAAAHTEYAKLDRALTASELRGLV